MQTLDTGLKIQLILFDARPDHSFIFTEAINFEDAFRSFKMKWVRLSHPKCGLLRGNLRYYLDLPEQVVTEFKDNNENTRVH